MMSKGGSSSTMRPVTRPTPPATCYGQRLAWFPTAPPSRSPVFRGEPFLGAAVPFTLNRSATNIQYTASNRVFQTVDAQALWTPITPALTVGPGAFITALAVAEHNPDVVCAGTTEGRVWCTSNASAGVSSTWTDRSAGLPARAVTRITI